MITMSSCASVLPTARHCALAACATAGCGLEDVRQQRKVGPVVLACALFDALCVRYGVPRHEREAVTGKCHRGGHWARMARRRFPVMLDRAAALVRLDECDMPRCVCIKERLTILDRCCEEAMGIQAADNLPPSDHFRLAARAAAGHIAFVVLGVSHTAITAHLGAKTSDNRVSEQVKRARHPVIARAVKAALAKYRQAIAARERPLSANETWYGGVQP